MAEKKFSELPAASSIVGDEVIPVVQIGNTVQTTILGVAPVRSVNEATGDVEVSDRVVDLGAVTANTAIPLGAAAVYTLTLADDVTLSATGMQAGRSRAVQVRVTASGARVLAFSSDWKWAGTKPAALASGAQGMLFLTSDGATEADVIASWQALGDGS